MLSQPIIETIKTTVHSIIPDARILLFGSMARGDTNKDSDYDVLVIIPDTLPLREKRTWKGNIHRALVYALDSPVDVLLNSEEEVKKKIKLPGHIVQWAIKEGIEL